MRAAERVGSDGRALVVSHPARRIVGYPAFRGFPVVAGHRSQHIGEQAVSAGRERDHAAPADAVRPAQDRISFDGKGAGAGPGHDRAAPVGREMGTPSCQVLADKRDGQPIRRVTIQAHDGRALELKDLVWLCPDEVTPMDQEAATAA